MIRNARGFVIAHVRVGTHDSVEKAIKRFKRLVDKEGIVREYKRREFFEKPSTIRNRKKKNLERKLEKRLRRLRVGRLY